MFQAEIAGQKGWDTGMHTYTNAYKCDFDEETDHKPLESIGIHWNPWDFGVRSDRAIVRNPLDVRSWCTLCLCTLPTGGQINPQTDARQYISPPNSQSWLKMLNLSIQKYQSTQLWKITMLLMDNSLFQLCHLPWLCN